MPAVTNNSSRLMLLTAQLLLLSATVEGFQNHCASRLPSSTTREGGLIVNSKVEDDEDLPLSVPLPTPSSQLEDGNFNPFDYKRSSKNSSRSAGSTPPRVDLRSIRMSSVTGDLLNSLGDESAMRTILEDNRDFLLEPLEVPDSLAASGSDIYTPDMSRSERYQAYRKSVEDRVKSSNNEKAKAVLTAMKDYVLEFEEKSPL